LLVGHFGVVIRAFCFLPFPVVTFLMSTRKSVRTILLPKIGGTSRATLTLRTPFLERVALRIAVDWMSTPLTTK
jgi:hypothetical protein